MWKIKLAALGAVISMGFSAAAVAQSNNGAAVGNGGFLLNVIAFENCPDGTFLDSNRHQIAVRASYQGNGTDKTARANKIFLSKGDDFWVEDGNACDDGAIFHLPITEENCAGCALEDPNFTQYEVRARVLGPRGSAVSVTSCVEESGDDQIVVDDDTEISSLCSVGSNVWAVERVTGNGKEQNKFDNVSAELLTVCVDTDGDMACDERIGLFDPRGQDYWWTWDTWGRPHVQLVFVPVLSGTT